MNSNLPTPLSRRFMMALWLVVACAVLTVSAQEAKKKEAPQSTTSPSPIPSATPSQPLPTLTEIATGVDDLKRLLGEVNRRLANDADRWKSNETGTAIGLDLDARVQEADEVLSSMPSLPEVQDLDSEWRSIAIRVNALRKSLLGSAAVINGDITWLNSQQAKWQAVLAQIEPDPSLAELQTRVRQSLDEIHTTQSLANEQLKTIVTLQSRLSEDDQFVRRVQERINTEKARIQRSLFQADSRPLWDFSANKSDIGVQRVLRRHLSRDWIRLGQFVSTNKKYLAFTLAVVLLVLLSAFKMRRNLSAWTKSNLVKPRNSHIFERPYSLAILAGLISTFPLLPVAPTVAKGILSLIVLIPVIRLIGPLLPVKRRQLLYTLVISTFAVEGCKIIAVSSSTKRVLLALLSVGIAGLVAWLSKGDGYRGFWSKAFLLSVRVGIVMMLISFVANVFGYFGLSQVITEGVLFGAYYAVVLYTSREVLRIVSSILLKTETALRSRVIRNHRVRINSWFVFIITLIACVAWVSSILRLLTVRDDLVDSLKTALTTPIVSGTNSFNAASVLSFILVIIIGLMVATIVRVVLREDVLKRLPVRQGVPFAVSMVTYYVMLFFVFVLALVAAGVELSKFTLFTGAFGIGVGFGLQNTINNFASGLILLFERPIRETDILEVDGAFGEVTRIGMRSTSLRTSQEAEVIIPNSTLVAGKVINWSRLGRRRPIELLVRVAYGADPREVIDLLVKTAAAQSDVLRDPAPSAFLQRFGEKSLEFTLVFWVGRYHLHRKVLSEVAVSVTTNFREAGIQMPGSDKESLVRSVSGNDHEMDQDQTSSVTNRESPVDARATDQHN